MSTVIVILFYSVNLIVVPLLLMGVIRKVKALMQNRIGPPILQPFFDTAKLLCKGETISDTASFVFIWAPRVSLAAVIMAAVLVPWAGRPFPGGFGTAGNFIFIVYLLGLGKFFSMLAAVDTGSAFGGLGASREAAISVLVEPAQVMALTALALNAGSMDLDAVFGGSLNPAVAALCGMAFVITAMAELSRMPVDDPTTHLELTMVHEAMILENSGRTLALIEYAAALRFCVFFGLAAQTLLHIWPHYEALRPFAGYGAGLISLFILGISLAVAEGILVKLNWRRIPNFVTFAMVLSILAVLVAVAGR